MPIMNENAQNLVDLIAKQNGAAFDIRELIANCTLDIICGIKN